MKRLMLSLAALVVAAAVPGSSHAQNVSFHFGGGIAMGAGDLSDDTDTGWLGFAGVDMPIMSMPGFAVGATASYAHIPYSGDGGEATNIPALFGELGYLFGATSASMVKPWVRAGVGVMQHRYDPGDTSVGEESETKVGFGGGGGISFVMRQVSPFVGAHYITAGSDTGYFSVYVGLTIGGGGSSNSAFRRR